MYTHFIHTAYDPLGQYESPTTGDPTGYLTWNVVWWDTQFDKGDVITFEYLTPVSFEDEYIFTPSAEFRAGLSENIPFAYELAQNYPNPFNPITNIKYIIPEKTMVSITIYDILGRQIIKLVDKQINAGTYNTQWDGKNNSGEFVSTGIYYNQLETDKFVKTKKMVLLK